METFICLIDGVEHNLAVVFRLLEFRRIPRGGRRFQLLIVRMHAFDGKGVALTKDFNKEDAESSASTVFVTRSSGRAIIQILLYFSLPESDQIMSCVQAGEDGGRHQPRVSRANT